MGDLISLRYFTYALPQSRRYLATSTLAPAFSPALSARLTPVSSPRPLPNTAVDTPLTSMAGISEEETTVEMARRKEERRLWIQKLKEQKRALLPLARCLDHPISSVGNRAELVLSTATAILASDFRNPLGRHPSQQPLLPAVYTFDPWLCFALLISPGYMAYKQHTFNLEGKLMLSGLAISAQTAVSGSKTSFIAADITPPSPKPLSPKPVTPAPFSQGAKKLASTSETRLVPLSRHLGSMTYNSGVVSATGTTYAPSHDSSVNNVKVKADVDEDDAQTASENFETIGARHIWSFTREPRI
ncbi:hypothetical protein DEU56DRAFT_945851 [Suillus clintonianus]|uniref:uncharacterized protein n=1 Tax=Suillus clintonianus TaxID=1904413 RepID=UPI001B87EFAE|nr:uncharacterized protein DEU56DRAFT_945851 [Suillus clintonianus]KAG2138021.1 hypothetical protein DEU56DRAFT_945851 [Suillus clintonianus]